MRQMSEVNQKRLEELQHIEAENGILKVDDVVTFAKDPTTALHSWSGWKGWDVTVAANEFYKQQARTLIRGLFTYEATPDGPKKFMAFVSIIDDRKQGGGYRPMLHVMQDSDWKARLLNTALSELRAFQVKYDKLVQLAGVMKSIDEALASTEAPAAQAQDSAQQTA
jgi:hypothetical protein